MISIFYAWNFGIVPLFYTTQLRLSFSCVFCSVSSLQRQNFTLFRCPQEAISRQNLCPELSHSVQLSRFMWLSAFLSGVLLDSNLSFSFPHRTVSLNVGCKLERGGNGYPPDFVMKLDLKAVVELLNLSLTLGWRNAWPFRNSHRKIPPVRTSMRCAIFYHI